MKILLYSPAFLPSVGGLELGVASLARELGSLGHAVVVMTETPGSWHEPLPFAVIRRPSRRSSLAWMRWCEVFFQANVSLRGLWPLLLVPRPWAVSHHSWYCQVNGRIALRDRLKRGLLRLACCSVAVSEAMARELATTWPRHRPQVIPNSYRSETFRLLPEVAREKELIFVGRLVSDKGADFLLEALALLAEEGLRPRLTIVGEGPEKAPLEAQVSRLGLISQLTFIGLVTGSALARELNAHHILVVPSRYAEPFGVVALEGIACGCAVVGSKGGGLPEAIGPCGLLFENSDVAGLAACLRRLLSSPEEVARLLERSAEHLARHQPDKVAAAYVRALGPCLRPQEGLS